MPGISSAFAVPAAGIPVTDRRLASSVTIVTGHEDPRTGTSVDWNWIAGSRGTVVVLMGLRHLTAICDRLIEAGRAADTPAAAIGSGTCRDQQVITAPLGELAEAVRIAQLPAPTLIVIGDVVRFRDLLAPNGLPEPLVAVTEPSRGLLTAAFGD